MAKFPIQRAVGTTPGTSGNAPASFSTDTGGAFAGRMMQSAGQSLMQLADTIDHKQADAEYTKYMTDAQDQVSKMFIDFEKNPDESTYQSRWDETYNALRSNMPKNRRARRAYNQSLLRMKTGTDELVFKAYGKRVDEKHKWAVAKWETSAEQSVRSGIMSKDQALDVLKSRLDASVEAGTMSEDERDVRLAKVIPMLEEKEQYFLMDSAYRQAFKLAQEKGVKSGLDYLEEFRKSDDMPDGINDYHMVTLKSRLERDVSEQEQKQVQSLRQLLESGKLTLEHLNTYARNPEQHKQYLKYIDIQNDPTIMTKSSSWVSGYEDVMKRWDGDMDLRKTSDELFSRRMDDVGLSADDYDHLKDMAANPYDQDIQAGLRTIFEATKSWANVGLFINMEERRQIEKINKAVLAWVDAEIEKGRHPSPEDMYIKAKMYNVKGLPNTPIQEEPKKPLTESDQLRILRKADGDPDKAIEMAREEGFDVEEKTSKELATEASKERSRVRGIRRGRDF